MYHLLRPALTSLVMSVLLVGTVLLGTASAARAAGECPASLAGTQAYAECLVRELNGTAPTTPVELPEPTSSPAGTSVTAWQLALSALAGAVVAGGLAVGGRHLTHRRVHMAS